jgi:hypothetical protein
MLSLRLDGMNAFGVVRNRDAMVQRIEPLDLVAQTDPACIVGCP